MRRASSNSVAIIGGGLAGLAAAEAACRHGLRAEIFEQSARLGGRAGAFVESCGDCIVDYSQHAAMGCCTNFLDFCRRTGVDDYFRREKEVIFLGPDYEPCKLAPSRWLPAPFHLWTSLKRLSFLSRAEWRGVARALRTLAATKGSGAVEQTFEQWLDGQQQSKKVVERFWSVVVHSALSETVEHVSLSAARKVFIDGFFSSQAAGEMILPTMPLGEILDRRVGQWLVGRGVAIHRRTRVMWIETDENMRPSVVLSEGEIREFDTVLVAVPWYQAAGLFPPDLLSEVPEVAAAQDLVGGTIATLHFWFDRAITPLPHSILVGKLSQCVFRTPYADSCREQQGKVDGSHAHGERGHGTGAANGEAAYYHVLISAAHQLITMGKEALLEHVLKEVREAFHAASGVRLLHSRVIMQPQAVFSMRPGVEKLRPAQTSRLPNVFLAGDWTDTGWPATMEGAVRSGYLAVEALLKTLGHDQKVMVPDLRRGFFARKIIGD